MAVHKPSSRDEEDRPTKHYHCHYTGDDPVRNLGKMHET